MFSLTGLFATYKLKTKVSVWTLRTSTAVPSLLLVLCPITPLVIHTFCSHSSWNLSHTSLFTFFFFLLILIFSRVFLLLLSMSAYHQSSLHVSHFSHVWLCVTLWTVAHQAPLSMGSSPGKNTGVGCRALLHRVFLTQGSNPGLMSLVLAGRFFTTSTTWEAPQSSLIFYLFHEVFPVQKDALQWFHSNICL